MKRFLSSLLIIGCIYMLPVSTFADSKTYPPPAKRGVIFAVVRFKQYSSRNTNHSTRVSVQWGGYSKSKSYPRPTSMTPSIGVVIRLSHNSEDTVPITVDSDGKVERLVQAADVPEWNNSFWAHETWR